MKQVSHDKVNMEWNAYEISELAGKDAFQLAALAEHFTALSRKLAEAQYEVSILQQTIEKLTGMDSVDAVLKAFDGVDYIEMSRE